MPLTREKINRETWRLAVKILFESESGFHHASSANILSTTSCLRFLDRLAK